MPAAGAALPLARHAWAQCCSVWRMAGLTLRLSNVVLALLILPHSVERQRPVGPMH